jgi:nucleoside-diphosphate-sugar epimerase
MTFIVIGGSGFIGTRLCNIIERESRSFTIVDKCLSRSYPSFTKKSDVRSLNSLRESIPHGGTIINLAAEHRDDVSPRSLYWDVNVAGAKNICTIANEKGINRIIFTSSVAVYGFATPGTDESGKINPFNDYGRTKYEAEKIFKSWQAECPNERSLVIIRPTVVFGERNRGNVFNLFRQISSGKFLMIGNGNNRKSMAYVENVASFILHCSTLPNGVHLFNYIDKPDFTMNVLVRSVKRALGRDERIRARIPYAFGYLVGAAFDLISYTTRKRFPMSAIRVKKFCSESQYNTSVSVTGFKAPVSLLDALEMTIRHEFIDPPVDNELFYTE